GLLPRWHLKRRLRRRARHLRGQRPRESCGRARYGGAARRRLLFWRGRLPGSGCPEGWIPRGGSFLPGAGGRPRWMGRTGLTDKTDRTNGTRRAPREKDSSALWGCGGGLLGLWFLWFAFWFWLM